MMGGVFFDDERRNIRTGCFSCLGAIDCNKLYEIVQKLKKEDKKRV